MSNKNCSGKYYQMKSYRLFLAFGDLFSSLKNSMTNQRWLNLRKFSHFGSNLSQKKVPNHYPDHLLFRCSGQWHKTFFWRFESKWNFSEINLPLDVSYPNARVTGEYSISLSSDVKSETDFSSAGNEGNFFFDLNDGWQYCKYCYVTIVQIENHHTMYGK